MFSSLTKLRNNLAPKAAIAALGVKLYIKYLTFTLSSFHKIVRERNIRCIDGLMSPHATTFFRNGKAFVYDCAFADRLSDAERSNNYAFGIAREIYIRDCYFKHLPRDAFEKARIVVDIGSNRGAFACMMTTAAARIVAVEAIPDLDAVIQHNLKMNRFEDFAVEVSFLGTGGEFFDASFRQVDMKELLDRHKLERVDLMKIDIEGSEFSLFSNPDWLRRVSMLTMEVHPRHGAVSIIVKCLQEHGFQVRAADDNLQLLSDVQDASFVYAWRT